MPSHEPDPTASDAPAKDPHVRVTISLPPDLLADIDEVAHRLKFSRSAIVSTLLSPMADLYLHNLRSFGQDGVEHDAVQRMRGGSLSRLALIAAAVDWTGANPAISVEHITHVADAPVDDQLNLRLRGDGN